MVEIIPNIGIGDVHFGMLRNEVTMILGEKQTWEEWMGGNLNDSLLYPGIILSFDKHDSFGPLSDGRLNQIEINAKYPCTLFGREIGNITKQFALSNINSAHVFPSGLIHAAELGMEIFVNLDDTLRGLILTPRF